MLPGILPCHLWLHMGHWNIGGLSSRQLAEWHLVLGQTLGIFHPLGLQTQPHRLHLSLGLRCFFRIFVRSVIIHTPVAFAGPTSSSTTTIWAFLLAMSSEFFSA